MKGLDWIAIDPDIADDPKVIAMALLLKKDRYHIAGRFPAFLGAVARHAPDGTLAQFSDAVLDSWAGGLKGFGVAIRRTMCDEGDTITAWAKFNGKKLTSLQSKRDRVATWREEKRRQKEVQGQNATDSVPVQNKNSTPLTDTDTDTDTENLTREKDSSSSRAERYRRELETAVAIDAPQYADRLLGELRAAHDPAALVYEINALRQGLHGPGGRAVPLAIIGRAMHEVRLNGEQFTAQRLRVFCGKLMRDGAKPEPTQGGDEVMAEIERLKAKEADYAA